MATEYKIVVPPDTGGTWPHKDSLTETVVSSAHRCCRYVVYCVQICLLIVDIHYQGEYPLKQQAWENMQKNVLTEHALTVLIVIMRFDTAHTNTLCVHVVNKWYKKPWESNQADRHGASTHTAEPSNMNEFSNWWVKLFTYRETGVFCSGDSSLILKLTSINPWLRATLTSQPVFPAQK